MVKPKKYIDLMLKKLLLMAMLKTDLVFNIYIFLYGIFSHWLIEIYFLTHLISLLLLLII